MENLKTYNIDELLRIEFITDSDIIRWYDSLINPKVEYERRVYYVYLAQGILSSHIKEDAFQNRRKQIIDAVEKYRLNAKPKTDVKSDNQPSKEGGASNRRMLNGTKGIMEEFGWKSQTTALFYKNNVFAPAVFQPKKGGKFQVDAEMARELMNEFNEKNKTSD